MEKVPIKKENRILEAKIPDKDREILDVFSAEEQQKIKETQKMLSGIAYFIGKDFKIPVELNNPGEGWHWDFEANKIKIDPKDLLEKPMDYLRCIIAHEGGHRRISRTESIPLELWNEPGFAFMMNAIEDPRNNNFLAENYPKFKEQLDIVYGTDVDAEEKSAKKAQKKLGRIPRFMQAGFEYIKQWYKERKGESHIIDETLPEEVQEVVGATLEAAKDSWWRYPSRKEADTSEEIIKEYAKISYEINRDEVWPEFKKLVEHDKEDQEVQDLLQDFQKGESGEDGPELPQELKEQLTPEEREQLKEALTEARKATAQQQKEAREKGEEEPSPTPVAEEAISEGIKEKIKEYIEGLPEEERQALKERAKESLEAFGKEIAEELQGKLSENPETRVAPPQELPREPKKELKKPKQEPSEELKELRKTIRTELAKNEHAYEETMREVLPIIEELEQDLREIFIARRETAWKGGYKFGKRIDIKKRIQEKAKGIPAVESKAWEKRKLPEEKDYAISLLVDLSGSMQGEKIQETFKAVVVLAEVLNKLSLNIEILGFNNKLYPYQEYGSMISQAIRKKMGEMREEVSGEGARWNDDGWALGEASKRLAKQKAQEKFLITLSDGMPEESPAHSGSEYDLRNVIKKIKETTNQKLIGLGIGPDTRHVETYYPNSVAEIGVEEMSKKIADLIREVIAHYDRF